MSPKFNQLTTTEIGLIGEAIVKQHLEKKYVIYAPENDEAHPFDKFCVERMPQEGRNREVFIAEIKTKICRDQYPDTGFNTSSYKDYKFMQDAHKIKVKIFFVDYREQKVYGNWLDVLEEERQIETNHGFIQYPLEGFGRGKKPVTYFPREVMDHYFDLEEEDCKKILEKSEVLKK
tara:strand:+ start:65 stop:592 length:528 start_codon:yes stop_codon:yes gene_type:complete